MKQVYNSIPLAPGATNAGICTVQLAAKEWLAGSPVTDFNTGSVLLPVSLLPGYNWMQIDFTPLSYEYDEKPKENKSGTYFEVSFSGNLNTLDASLQQSLESLRHHEVVMIIQDRKYVKKIVGDKITGMILKYSNRIINASGGSQTPAVDLYLQAESIPPYYAV